MLNGGNLFWVITAASEISVFRDIIRWAVNALLSGWFIKIVCLMKEHVCVPIFKAKKKSGLAKSTTNVKLKKMSLICHVGHIDLWVFRFVLYLNFNYSALSVTVDISEL